MDIFVDIHIPVVKTDYVKTSFSEAFAEFILPEDHLGAQSHDEKERGITLYSKGIIGDLDAVCAGIT